VLFDRDGTIVIDVPYNGDPELVQPVSDAKASLDRLRAAGVRVGVLTNQSGIGRGMITAAMMLAVNARIEELLGPFDGWYICPHAPQDDCDCRKPKPKLVFDAATAWGISPSDIVVIGDKQSDVDVATNAGARGVLTLSGAPLGPIIDELL
jgi:HAD superfamily hydrolase (TIGR01662 family)